MLRTEDLRHAIAEFVASHNKHRKAILALCKKEVLDKLILDQRQVSATNFLLQALLATEDAMLEKVDRLLLAIKGVQLEAFNIGIAAALVDAERPDLLKLYPEAEKAAALLEAEHILRNGTLPPRQLTGVFLPQLLFSAILTSL